MLKKHLEESLTAIEALSNHFKPEIGLILGSGLGVLADEIENKIVIPYSSIPNFPKSTVQGHAGQMVLGTLEGRRVLAYQGRIHYYEGQGMAATVYPVRLLQAMGIKKLILTNASGGVNTSFTAGDFMIMDDHINLMGTNPLIGPNDESLGVRFPDMSECYTKHLRALADEVARQQQIKVQHGVYAAMSGPVYETPSEVKMVRLLGADAVGMSTVPEALVASHAGMDCLGISCITNMAAGVLDQKLDHSEVMETAERVKPLFIKLVKGIIEKM